MRLDLHNHTSFSADGGHDAGRAAWRRRRPAGSTASPSPTTTPCRGALSALSLSEADPSLPRVIPGIEVFTEDGEVIGLYVREDIPKGTPLDRSGEPHPRAGRPGLSAAPLRRVPPRGRSRAACAPTPPRSSDVVEVANGRALGPRAGAKSARLAARHGKPRGAGSDAHRKREVGRATWW